METSKALLEFEERAKKLNIPPEQPTYADLMAIYGNSPMPLGDSAFRNMLSNSYMQYEVTNPLASFYGGLFPNPFLQRTR